ncbi:hypothetical protein F4782DRAFT_533429 [Xylaria castorea]|nr:hypothetical protein F4782DRAFT_533429 [Xylaria castorea]
MDSSTQADQPSPQPSVDRLAWDLMQDSPQPAISESGTEKRDFDSSFPLSPGQGAKRLCSRFPVHLVPGNTNGDALDNSSINIEDAIEDDGTSTAHMPCETLQTRPTLLLDPLTPQEAPIDAPKTNATSHIDDIKQLEHSRNKICKHIDIIKQNTPNCQIDRDTATILVNELADLMAAEGSVPPVEIVQMRINIAKLYHVVTSPCRLEAGQVNPQMAPSSISSISELTPIPSDIYTLPPSRRGSEAVTFSPKLENRCIQTEEATIGIENDALVLPDARYNGLSDIELWERELESIRRLQPIVDGSYTTVNVPLRASTSQLAPANRSVPVSTQQGLKNNFNFMSKLKSTPGPALRSSAVAGGSRGSKGYDVISVHDTSDDEVEDMHARVSHVSGGGDLIYGINQVQYATSNEDEETNFHVPRFRHELQLDGNNDAINRFPDYGDKDMHENIQGEEVIQYANQPTASTARRDYKPFDDGRSYQGEESDDSLFFGGESGEPDGSRRWDPSSITPHGYTMVTNKGITGRRDRSRSPGYQLARLVKTPPYREERHHHHEDKRHQSPAWAHREKRYHKRRIYVKRGPAFARNVNQYGQVRQRYMRDEPESPQFYGYSGKWSPEEVESTLRYQDRFNNVGEIPGPKSSLRLDLDGYIKDSGINDDALGLERDIESVHENTFYAGETIDEEQALHSSWANKPTTLYKGFPLVENIGFVAIRNNAKPEGDCYWRALAYILSGQPTRWDLIKADHQAYLRHVLSDKTHPRHELYAKLNAQFFETHGTALSDGSFNVTSTFKANLWQLLHIPHSWTPGVMQQVTADLYNIHLVTFEYHKRNNMCLNVSVRGAYNSRHVFMLFMDGGHFQPLAVNEYLG